VGITFGLDGRIWFTENNGNRIGRISTGGLVTTTIAQTYNDAVFVGGDEDLTMTGGGGITFNSSIDGESNSTGDLTINTPNFGAQLRLNGAVGNMFPLDSLTINDAGPATIVGALQGAGTTLIKNGSGTLTFSAINSYSGATTVNSGVLLVNGATGVGSVIIGPGAALGGSGVVNGPVALSGFLTPGASPGILTTGNLMLAPGSTYFVDVNSPYTTAGVDYDQTRVFGGVTINGAVLNLNIGSTASSPSQILTIIDNDGSDALTVTNPFQTPAGTPLPEGSLLSVGNFAATISYHGGDGNDVVLTRVAPRVTSTQVNDGTAQRSRVTSLTVTFNAQVTFATTAGAAFTLTRVSDGAAVSFTATAQVIGGVTVVTLNNFTGSATQFGSLTDGRYTLTAIAGQISSDGLALDGNGDGTPGDNFTFGDAQGLFRLFGDVNGDQTVNGFDLGFFRNAFGTQTGDSNYLSYLDLNGDGVINGFDLGQFRTRFGTMLP
jgi:autotransporter-associated beta strand protein